MNFYYFTVIKKKKKSIFASLFRCCFRCRKIQTAASLDSMSFTNGPNYGTYLLGPQAPQDTEKICLVIDLDETLVHSSFKVTTKSLSLSLSLTSKFAHTCLLDDPIRTSYSSFSLFASFFLPFHSDFIHNKSTKLSLWCS